MTRGFSLIELLIGLSIFAFLAMLAVPMYAEFLANTQVRTAAESVLSGVRLAQAEAVRRSVPVRFELESATKWRVVFVTDEKRATNCGADTACTNDNHLDTVVNTTCAAGADCVVKEYDFSNGAPKATLTNQTGGSVVTFTSLGMPMATNQDGSGALQRVDATTSLISSPRTLRVIVGGLVSSKGGTLMCDLALSSPDPLACPPTS
ncbi:MAG: GspH/FimT family pseudopilin [Proteobacteria bacterium]|nr:GspH/FimT family pseudopilin [Pseudomonadota bacterium]